MRPDTSPAAVTTEVDPRQVPQARALDRADTEVESSSLRRGETRRLEAVSPPARPELEYEMTLPTKLVRKAGIDSVLLTDIVALGDNRFACAGQVPRAHSLVNDAVAPRYEFYDV